MASLLGSRTPRSTRRSLGGSPKPDASDRVVACGCGRGTGTSRRWCARCAAMWRQPKPLRLRGNDRELGFESENGRRYSRCLRCDAWTEGFPPAAADVTSDVIPPLGELELPRRGPPLHDAVILRLIAIDRGLHAVVFGLLTIALTVVDTKLFDLQSFARDAADRLDGVASNTGPHASHDALSRELHRIAELRQGTITTLAVTAAVYCIVEGVEAVGLWRERRWAEYLTVVATAGFLPFEIRELLDRVSLFRIGALVVNIAILSYLIYAKRLFG